MPRNVRVKLFRTWGSGLGMLPIGGPAVWGNSTWAPDDTEEMKENNQTYGYVLSPKCSQHCWALSVCSTRTTGSRQWLSASAIADYQCKPCYHSKGCVCNAPTTNNSPWLLACTIADY